MRIRWSTTARDELAKMWLKADSYHRRALTAAADGIDNRLRTNPEDEGESRWDDWRVLFERPLGVLFRVEEHESVVHVYRVWQFF